MKWKEYDPSHLFPDRVKRLENEIEILKSYIKYPQFQNPSQSYVPLQINPPTFTNTASATGTWFGPTSTMTQLASGLNSTISNQMTSGTNCYKVTF